MLSVFKKYFGKRTSKVLLSEIRYPPKPSAYPMVSVTELLASNTDIISKIDENFSGTNEEWDLYYKPLIEQYAAYVHLLPASKKHHHKFKGGLLSHGLEVAFFCIRIFETKLWALRVPPSRRGKTQSAWRLSVFAAGLLHDIGKPASDMIIRSDTDNDNVWNAYTQSFMDWGKDITHYHVDWRDDDRHQRHEKITQGIAIDILPAAVIQHIATAPFEDVMTSFMLAFQRDTNNKISQIVSEADSRSVKNDLLTHADIGQDGEPETMAVLLASTMGYMFKQGKWKLNKPGHPLWCIDDHVFLVWPEAAKTLTQQLLQDRVVGIPRNADVFLNMLLSTGLAIPFTSEQGVDGNPFWLFKPSCLKGKNLLGLCMASHTIFSATPLVNIEGVIIQDTEVATKAPVVSSQKETVSPKEKPSKAKPDSCSIQGKDTVEDTPQKKPSDPPKQKAKAQKTAQAIVAETTTAKADKRVIDRLGHLREMLLALADDIRRGTVKRGEHFVVHKECLALKYPSSIDGYGLEPKTVMNRLSKNNVLFQDPIAPHKKILEVAGFGLAGAEKVLVLDLALSNELFEIACIDTASSTKRKSKEKPIKTQAQKESPLATNKDSETKARQPLGKQVKKPFSRAMYNIIRCFNTLLPLCSPDHIKESGKKTWVGKDHILGIKHKNKKFLQDLLLNTNLIETKVFDGKTYIEVLK